MIYWKRPKEDRGQPRVEQQSEKRHLSLRISEELYKQLEAYAQGKGLTVTEAAVQAFEKLLGQPPPEIPKPDLEKIRQDLQKLKEELEKHLRDEIPPTEIGQVKVAVSMLYAYLNTLAQFLAVVLPCAVPFLPCPVPFPPLPRCRGPGRRECNTDGTQQDHHVTCVTHQEIVRNSKKWAREGEKADP